MAREPTAYWDFIRVESLLDLQHGLEKEAELSNDEVLFIVVHQIDELWFKLILREMQSVRNLFAQERVPETALAAAVRGIRRMSILLQQAAQQFSLMETLTTRDYLGFRDKLFPASGFQSAQMREIEILLGLDEKRRIPLGHEGTYFKALLNPDGSESPAYRRVMARLEDRPSLRDAVHRWLSRTPIRGSVPGDEGDDATVQSFIDDYCAAQLAQIEVQLGLAKHNALTPEDAQRLRTRYEKEAESARAFLNAEDANEDERALLRRVRAATVFIESYRELPLLAWPREVVDTLVEFEQAFVIFRQRHARMVERVIGRRTGTGGSAGVEYLDKTALTYRIFEDVWAVRSLLLRDAALPKLEDPAYYDFAQGPGVAPRT